MLDKIEQIFVNREPGIIGNPKKNAVMILLCEDKGETKIIFEVRSFKLRSQPGDVCLPGGKMECGETPERTSLRETMEELNLTEENIDLIGSMDYLITPYNFIIYPFVAKTNKIDIEPNKDEVDHIFKVPIKFFMETLPKLHELSITPNPGEEFPYHLIRNGRNYKFRSGKIPQYFYKYNNYIIWGFTALIIKIFVDIIKEKV